jgi:hypothetical protein
MFYQKRTYCLGTFASVVLIILLFSPLLFAFQNEPEDFRGIKWGADIAELPDMRLAEDNGETKYYHRKNEEMKIGEASIERLAYGFYKGKFCSVFIVFNNFANFSRIKKAFDQLYGEGHRKNKLMQDYNWDGSDIHIMLQYKGVSELGYAAYWYKPIAREREEDEEEKFTREIKDLNQ